MSSSHNLSRGWPSIVPVGFAIAIMTSGILLWLFPDLSSVVAYVQVKSNPQIMSSLDQPRRQTAKNFEVFQQTHLALLKSQLVLQSALSLPEISQLDAVIKEEPDPVRWLMEELRVSFPGEGEILEVRYDGEEKPEEMKIIIDAVIAAYNSSVLKSERNKSVEAHNNEEDASQQHVQVMQSARASENINKVQRYAIASIGGMAALCLTCLVGVLMGFCANTLKRHTGDETC